MSPLFSRWICYRWFVQIKIQTMSTRGIWLLCLSSCLFSVKHRRGSFGSSSWGRKWLRRLQALESGLKVTVSMLRPNWEKRDQIRQRKGHSCLFPLPLFGVETTCRDTSFLQLSPPVHKEAETRAPQLHTLLLSGGESRQSLGFSKETSQQKAEVEGLSIEKSAKEGMVGWEGRKCTLE